MTNPFKPHALDMFAKRDTVDQALAYACDLINTFEGGNKAAAWTALMVVVNTAAAVWPEAPAQEPDLSDLGALRSRIAALEERLSPEALSQDISSQACAWLDDNFNERADQWLNDEADLDDKIETWVENNLDIENEVADALRDKVYDTVRRVIRDEVSVSISL